jgi:hypothetical protein
MNNLPTFSLTSRTAYETAAQYRSRANAKIADLEEMHSSAAYWKPFNGGQMLYSPSGSELAYVHHG